MLHLIFLVFCVWVIWQLLCACGDFIGKLLVIAVCALGGLLVLAVVGGALAALLS